MQIQSRDSFEAFEYFYVFELTEDLVIEIAYLGK